MARPPSTKTPRRAPRRNAEPQLEASMSHAKDAHAPLAAKPKPKLAPKIEVSSELLAHAHVSKAWPFEEARKVLSRLKRIPKPTGAIIFETGYGPSGLPHIGTFGEVARTTMVRHAFRVLTEDKIATTADLLLRRHGRLAQGPGQRPEQRDAGRASRQAADAGARPVRRPSELRPPQQCAAESLSRHVRLRLRIPLGDRVLHQRALRQDAAQGARSITRRSGT